MKRLLTALAFLTRAPLPSRWEFDAVDVGRATVLFPLVGAALGVINVLILYVFRLHISLGLHFTVGSPWLPAPVIAVLLVTISAWMTGAMHLDGLADMADGFGGGRNREDVLRIMRDHVIGAYGAVALILLVFIKVMTLSSLIERGAAAPYLIIAPALARWTSVPLGRFLPYARRENGGLGAAITEHVGWFELVAASLLAGIGTLYLASWRGAVCWLAVIAVTSLNAAVCMRRIGGVTGDTLGANVEVCESIVLLGAVALTR
jgi:cobalamin 5'-phosphate synthase/cobalamin synthase